MERVKAFLAKRRSERNNQPPPPKRVDTIVEGVPSRFVGVVRGAKEHEPAAGAGAGGRKKQKQRLMLVTRNMSMVFLGPNGLIERMLPAEQLRGIEFDNESGEIALSTGGEGPPVRLIFDDVNRDGALPGAESQDRKQKLLDFIGLIHEQLPAVPITLRRPPTPEAAEEEEEEEEEPVASPAEPEMVPEADTGAELPETDVAPPLMPLMEGSGVVAEEHEAPSGEAQAAEEEEEDVQTLFEQEAAALFRRAMDERERGLLLREQLQRRKAELHRIQGSVLGARQGTQLAMLVSAICERQMKLRALAPSIASPSLHVRSQLPDTSIQDASTELLAFRSPLPSRSSGRPSLDMYTTPHR